jgi:hypothetical protein
MRKVSVDVLSQEWMLILDVTATTSREGNESGTRLVRPLEPLG